MTNTRPDETCAVSRLQLEVSTLAFGVQGQFSLSFFGLGELGWGRGVSFGVKRLS